MLQVAEILEFSAPSEKQKNKRTAPATRPNQHRSRHRTWHPDSPPLNSSKNCPTSSTPAKTSVHWCSAYEYKITDVNKTQRTYDVFLHVGGNTRTIPFDDLYALYTELYRVGQIERDYLRVDGNCERVFRHKKYTQTPGATLFAILPHLDDAILVDKTDRHGNRQTTLLVKTPSQE